MSIAGITLDDQEIDYYFDFVEEAFKTTIIEIHEHVNFAFEEFSNRYLS